MIDISCKFYLQKNDMTFTNCINLVKAIIRHRKLLLTCTDLPTVALSHHVKIRALLTSGVVFAVDTYECFTENKNIRTICGCKPSKKTALNLIKVSLVVIKNMDALD